MKLYLDRWTEEKLGLDEGSLTRQALFDYQMEMLRKTVSFVKKESPFYREKLAGYEADFVDEEGFSWLPFTTPEELSSRGQEMLCVPQSEISRIVSLETGGSSGIPKRVYFTEADQELTVDFFAHGFRNLIGPEDKLLVLMPYRTPGSVGDLIRRGVERFGAEVHCLGLIDENLSYNTVLDVIYGAGITSIVGLPSQVHTLMKYTTKLHIDTVLLSADYVSPLVVDDLTKVWGCKVFEHYGMTEMGLGCAVSCERLKGYHIREADLYIEIIDPANGELQPDGRWGEIVFTTLTRKGMPLVRYRTGDISRIIKEPCLCGSVLRRLDRVKNRNMKKGWI
ncbi:MAG: DVU_1553 family AMP-dependent CoA ligase [Anaerovoracaceae bacterium]|jgi:phenylacetate-CoA ligase